MLPRGLRRGQVGFRSHNPFLSLAAPSPGRRRACVLFGDFFRGGYFPTELPGDTVPLALPPTEWGGLSVKSHFLGLGAHARLFQTRYPASTARTESRLLVRSVTSIASPSIMRVLVFPLPTSIETWPCPLMDTLSPLAKVTSAPLPAVRTVKPLSPAAMCLVAPESSIQVDNARVSLAAPGIAGSRSLGQSGTRVGPAAVAAFTTTTAGLALALGLVRLLLVAVALHVPFLFVLEAHDRLLVKRPLRRRCRKGL